jgi:hypothetical protein
VNTIPVFSTGSFIDKPVARYGLNESHGSNITLLTDNSFSVHKNNKLAQPVPLMNFSKSPCGVFCHPQAGLSGLDKRRYSEVERASGTFVMLLPAIDKS